MGVNKKDIVYLTLDVDWVPDYIIDDVATLLDAHDVKSTWFITHDSVQTQRLIECEKLFEVGIHPNFMPNSTQGETAIEIIDNLLDIAPKACSMRTHMVYQTGPMLAMIASYKQLKIDATPFLPLMDHIKPIEHLTGNGSFKRIATYWADDYEAIRQQWNTVHSCIVEGLGVKVINFHPIHLYLNTVNLHDYQHFQSNIHDLKCANSVLLTPYINTSHYGCRSLFLELIKNKNIEFRFIRSLLIEQ